MLTQNFLIKLAACNCPDGLVLPENSSVWNGRAFTFYSDSARKLNDDDMLALEGQECLIWINDKQDKLNGGKGLTAKARVNGVNIISHEFIVSEVSLISTNLGSAFLAEFADRTDVLNRMHTDRRKCIHRLDENTKIIVNAEIERREKMAAMGRQFYDATLDFDELEERSEKLKSWISSKYPPEGNSAPKSAEVFTTRYARLPEIVAYVRKRAKGRCELCEKHAPFVSRGNPFLEVHHLKTLAAGGTDTTSNTVAVCPNCHRALHYSDKKSVLLNELYDRCDFLKRESE